MTVAVLKNGNESLKRAIELCSGFARLKSTDKVLIKPNIVGGPSSQRPDGLVITLEMLEKMILLLREFGCENISVGEGSMVHKELGLRTSKAFVWSGAGDLLKKLEVPFVDLNEGPFEKIDLDGQSVEVAERIVHSDFLINMPVLKTHGITRVSLGMKNLKGCLSPKSKRLFHKSNLERCIALLNTRIRSDLTVIDGTFGLQRGPLGQDVHRMDVIVAGKDVLRVDTAGCELMRINPHNVIHMQLYAQINNVTDWLPRDKLKGIDIRSACRKIEWYSDWAGDLLKMHNVKGIQFEPPDYSSCSGCGMGIWVAVNKFLSEHKGRRFDAVQICTGREPMANPNNKLVFLLGKCAIETNPGLSNAVVVKGCPPGYRDSYNALKNYGVKLILD